jgi:hypothetical protein
MKVLHWNSEVHRDVTALLEKFGPNLQKLCYEEKASLSELRAYLELVPNITWLSLDLENEDFEDNDQSPLDLNELRELEINCPFNDDLLKFLTRLPPNVLIKLKQYSYNQSLSWDAYATLLSTQRKIKRLSICNNSFRSIPESLIDCLDLERLTWNDLNDPELKSNERDIQVLVKMTSKQRNLTHLKMYGIDLDDVMLKTIVDSLGKLKAFSFSFSNLSAEGIKVIEKLSKLEELALGRNILHRCKNDVIRSFADLDNSRLEVLKFMYMGFNFNAPSNVMLKDLRVMLKSWKKLTHLSEEWKNAFYNRRLGHLSRPRKATEAHRKYTTSSCQRKINRNIFYYENQVDWIMATDHKTRYESDHTKTY